MLDICFFEECNRSEGIHKEVSIDVSNRIYTSLVANFIEIGKSSRRSEKCFILISDDGIRFSRKRVIEIDAIARGKYIELLLNACTVIRDLECDCDVEQEKKSLENALHQFELVLDCMSNERIKFMQYFPSENDFDTENFVIGGLFEIRNNQIFVEWENEKILIAEKGLNPTNLLASGIHAIAEARHEGTISNDCYAYFMDVVSSFKPEIKPLESEIFKKKS